MLEALASGSALEEAGVEVAPLASSVPPPEPPSATAPASSAAADVDCDGFAFGFAELEAAVSAEDGAPLRALGVTVAPCDAVGPPMPELGTVD